MVPSGIFSNQKVFDLQASSTSMAALLKGDLISIPHLLFWSMFVTILSKLARKYVFFLDTKKPTSSTFRLSPCCCNSLRYRFTAFSSLLIPYYTTSVVQFEYSIAISLLEGSTLVFAAFPKFEAVRIDFRFSNHIGF